MKRFLSVFFDNVLSSKLNRQFEFITVPAAWPKLHRRKCRKYGSTRLMRQPDKLFIRPELIIVLLLYRDTIDSLCMTICCVFSTSLGIIYITYEVAFNFRNFISSEDPQGCVLVIS